MSGDKLFHLRMDELKRYLEELQSGAIKPSSLKTHMWELLYLMKLGLSGYYETITTNYTSDALVTVIDFVDDKRYEITIREVQK